MSVYPAQICRDGFETHPYRIFIIFFTSLFLSILTACDTENTNRTVTLTQHFSVDHTDGTVTVHYPSDWVARESAEREGAGILAFGNSVDALNAQVIEFEQGQLRGVVVLVIANNRLDALGLTTRPTPLEVLNIINDQNSENNLFEFNFGSPREIVENNRPITYVNGTTSYGGIPYDTINLVVDVGTGYLVITFGAMEGQIDQFLPEIRAIAGAIEYTPSP